MVSSTSCNKANISTLCTQPMRTNYPSVFLFFFQPTTVCTPFRLCLSPLPCYTYEKTKKKEKRPRWGDEDKDAISSEDKRKEKTNPTKRTGKSLANRKQSDG